MVKKKIIAGIVMLMVLILPVIFATDLSVSFELGSPQSLSVSATVSIAPVDIEEIQLCDGTCEYTKSIDPATEFTIKVTMQDDGDLNTFDAYFYQTSDTNECSEDWDCVKKLAVTSANANGCEVAGDVYCLTIEESDWTTKFIAGSADIWIRAIGLTIGDDFNESIGALTINNATATTLDSATATYSIAPNSAQNAILTDQANPYIKITHNGNINLDLNIIGDDFSYNGNTIDKANQKFNTANNYAEATAIDGLAQIFLSDWTKGIYPTSSIQNVWLWLNCPANQPAGNYTSALAIGAEAS